MHIPRFAAQNQDFVPFEGGYDTDTPPLQLPPSMVRRSQNFEIPVSGKGYKRLTGYERVDGRSKPSEAIYAILAATITGIYAAGNTLTGATSGATATIAMSAASASYFVITKVTGTFQAGENLQIGGVTVAVANSQPLLQ